MVFRIQSTFVFYYAISLNIFSEINTFNTFHSNKSSSNKIHGYIKGAAKNHAHKRRVSSIEQELLSGEHKDNNSPNLLDLFKNSGGLDSKKKDTEVSQNHKKKGQQTGKFLFNVLSQNNENVRVVEGKGQLVKTQNSDQSKKDHKILIKGKLVKSSSKKKKTPNLEQNLINKLKQKKKQVFLKDPKASIGVSSNKNLLKNSIHPQIELNLNQELQKLIKPKKKIIKKVYPTPKIMVKKKPIVKQPKKRFFNSVTRRPSIVIGRARRQYSHRRTKPIAQKPVIRRSKNKNLIHSNKKKTQRKKKHSRIIKPQISSNYIKDLKQKVDFRVPKSIQEFEGKKSKFTKSSTKVKIKASSQAIDTQKKTIEMIRMTFSALIISLILKNN